MRPPAAKNARITSAQAVARRRVVADIEGDPAAEADQRQSLRRSTGSAASGPAVVAPKAGAASAAAPPASKRNASRRLKRSCSSQLMSPSASPRHLVSAGHSATRSGIALMAAYVRSRATPVNETEHDARRKAPSRSIPRRPAQVHSLANRAARPITIRRHRAQHRKLAVGKSRRHRRRRARGRARRHPARHQAGPQDRRHRRDRRRHGAGRCARLWGLPQLAGRARAGAGCSADERAAAAAAARHAVQSGERERAAVARREPDARHDRGGEIRRARRRDRAGEHLRPDGQARR